MKGFKNIAAHTIMLSTVILSIAGSALATPPYKFKSQTLAKGQIGSLDETSYFVGENGKLWLSLLKTIGESDAYVVSNVWEPGGSTGWHTHPSYTLVIVTAGAITHYEADDLSCTPQVYTAGMAFVDRGGDHVHNVRNEGSVNAEVIAVRLVPTGQPGLIDEPDPGNCHF